MITEVKQIHPDGDVLEEARERINHLMRKGKSKEYDFAERLENAKQEVCKKQQKAREEIEIAYETGVEELIHIRAAYGISHLNFRHSRVFDSKEKGTS